MFLPHLLFPVQENWQDSGKEILMGKSEQKSMHSRSEKSVF